MAEGLNISLSNQISFFQKDMGNCFDCFKEAESQPEIPDPEEKRKRQEAAALKRQRENEGRGLHDPEGVKRKRQKQEQTEKTVLKEGQGGESGLKWTVG